jgi:hypothetical protein
MAIARPHLLIVTVVDFKSVAQCIMMHYLRFY